MQGISRSLAQLLHNGQLASTAVSLLKSCAPALATCISSTYPGYCNLLTSSDQQRTQQAQLVAVSQSHITRSISSSSVLFNTGSDSSGSGQASTPPPGPDQHQSKSLEEALDRLVDVAVEMVGQGKMDEAVGILKQGIDVLEVSHPGSAEVGELHNQVALLRFFQARADEAATHGITALEITKNIFGTRNKLTAHRMVRLGTIRFGQGQLGEAAPLLQEGVEMLQESREHDPGCAEGGFYLALTKLAGAQNASAVADMEPELVECLQTMKTLLGAESMIITLALTQHGRVVLALGGSGDFRLVEALYKQHTKLQEVRDPNSEDTALSAYKLAVLYYSQGMLQDARGELLKATQLLRSIFPEEHDLVVLCKHRLGMIAAAAGDHRAASQLLQQTLDHYTKEDEQHVLAAEAKVGLAAAKFRAVDVKGDKEGSKRQELLEQMQRAIKNMGQGLGEEHLLVLAAVKLYAELSMVASRG